MNGQRIGKTHTPTGALNIENAIMRLATEIGEILGRFLEKDAAALLPNPEGAIQSTIRNEAVRSELLDQDSLPAFSGSEPLRSRASR